MNVTDYTYLINQPDAINEKQIAILDSVLADFPYFQNARAIQLRGLYNQNSFQYNATLKKTAAYTTDRSILFDFITSDRYTSIDKALHERKILDSKKVDSEILINDDKSQIKVTKLEQSILTSIKQSLPLAQPHLSLNIEEKLAIGKPLDFSKKEQHSFQEWLQLSSTQPIDRESTVNKNESTLELNVEKRKKTELIDKFIETSPKISPVKHGVPSTATFDLNASDNSYLMTETLARVYLEQKKYQKAIQAYEILILKYPEKSSFFADRITDIKILQHNNN
ncbi:hypothetical protein SAMN05444396_104221 [Flavobacterium segetis]|uniref:Tetratricopeptide repeat-containing protein n=1 Tax=Flavobacterium segetis TaxID=271157 RepID=A0A1M5GY14_9FLAO|nr:tetratricopeptide repeat protein [Flavobacterium segetis]SHG08372.1 hypothetical protein SAMN05444396_104221 [Flavobacterium segetis]